MGVGVTVVWCVYVMIPVVSDVTISSGACHAPPSALQSYHCHTPRKLAATKMDPSCTFGMYCKDLDDFRRFCDEAEKVHTVCTGQTAHLR